MMSKKEIISVLRDPVWMNETHDFTKFDREIIDTIINFLRDED